MLVFDQLKKSDPQLRMMSVGILSGMGILLLGLWYVQVVSSKRYVQDLKRQAFRIVRVPAARGKILDRHGQALAENRPSYNLDLYLEELRDHFQDEFTRLKLQRQAEWIRLQTREPSAWKAGLQAVTGFFGLERSQPKLKFTRAERAALGELARYQVVSNLADLLSQRLLQPLPLDAKQFHQHFTNRLALPLPILENLTSNQTARFLERGPNPPGVDLEVLPMRHYPHQSAAGHLLGYVKRSDKVYDDEEFTDFHYRLPDFEGKVGIEGAFDQELRGRAGAKSVLVNSLGYRQSENLIVPAEPGKNVVLTIDVAIQAAAEKALRSAGADTRGAAVVLDPNNGDILALASSPSLDPNQLITISYEDWEKLLDPQLRPLLNRATQGVYPPGSIFKIIVALACLEAGLDTSATITNTGRYLVGKQPFKDPAPLGTHDFANAFKFSSNTYFIQFGLWSGLTNILKMGQRFLLGESARVETDQNQRGFFPTHEWIQKQKARGNPWTDGDTANLCIGQGDITVTPLQMAVMTAAIANGGKIYRPRLVQSIEPQESIDNAENAVRRPTQLHSEIGVPMRHLDIVRDAMLKDVEGGGTGTRALVPGLSVCGKTGTAQVKKGEAVIDHITWFVSFAPYDRPAHVVVVMIEGGASGGHDCAPLARQIYLAIQKHERDPGRSNSNPLAAAN